jgi:hypothetical protein
MVKGASAFAIMSLRLRPVNIAGATNNAVPAVAALVRKLRRELMTEIFILYTPGTGTAFETSTGPISKTFGPSFNSEFIISSHVTS